MENKKNYILIALFTVIIIAIGIIYISYNYNNDEIKENIINTQESDSYQYIELIESTEKENTNNQVINDKYQKKLENTSNKILKTKDGRMYILNNGNYLVKDVVVTINDKENKIFYINDKEKSLSSN